MANRIYSIDHFHLIVGNYDEDKLELLQNWFDIIEEDYFFLHFNFGEVYLNHYPVKTLEGMQTAKLEIAGHVHGLCKTQKQLINVGVDAWHFRAVSEEEISFHYTAMTKYYDKNVFPY